jgi:O-antigen/teichoic acid export membrane protein
MNLMCAQVLRNQFRAGTYAILNIVTLALMVSFSLLAALGLQMGVLGVLVGTLAAELVMLPVRILTTRDLLARRFSRAVLRQMLSYGIPLVPTSLAYWVFMTSDRILLGNLADLEQVGLYSVAVSVVNIASILILALGQAWNPHAVLAYEEDRAGAAVLFSRMLVYVLAGFGLVAVAMTTFAEELISVLAGSSFAGASAGVMPLAIGMVAYATTQVTAGGISLTGRTTYLAIFSWIAAITNLGLNFALIPAYGMIGAAVATAAAYVLLTLSYGVTSQRLWRLQFRWRSILFAVAITGVALVATDYLPQFGPGATPIDVVGTVAAKALFCLVVAMAMVSLPILDRGDAARLRSWAFSIRTRFTRERE